MRLEQLYYVIEIADSGSISTAAEKLHVSQPSISQSIVSLEKELNIKIFKRSRMGAEPTECGQLIIEKAREILNQIGDINKIVQAQNSLLTGSLSFATIPSLCLSILPKTLGKFKTRYPEVEIEVYEEGSRQASQRVLEGKVDFSLISVRKESQMDERLCFEPLLMAQVYICVGAQSPFANEQEVSLSEIIKYPIVTFNEKYNMNTFMRSILEPYGEPNILFASENSEVAKKVIAENLAIGFYTDIALKTDPYILNGQIIPLRIKEHNQSYSFHGIVYRKYSHLSVVVQKFIDELKMQASQFRRHYNLPDPFSLFKK